jgi:hypothetical protein
MPSTIKNGPMSADCEFMLRVEWLLAWLRVQLAGLKLPASQSTHGYQQQHGHHQVVQPMRHHGRHQCAAPFAHQ